MGNAIRWVVFLGLVVLFFPGLTGAQGRNLKVCTPGGGSGVMHLYTAKDRGYFAQEGMAVEILVARGQLCTTALITDQIEFSTNPNVFEAMVAGKVKAKVIYVTAKVLGHRFVVAPEVKSFNDLRGKIIAISAFGGLTDLLTREILDQYQMKAMKDVLLLQIGTPDVRYAALKSGKVQAALLSSTHALIAVEEGFRELEYEQPPWLSSPIIAKDELLARERSMVRSFLRATMKGHVHYGQKPTQAIALTDKVQRVNNPLMAKRIYEDDIRRHNPGGDLEEKNMRRVIERAREMLKVQQNVDPRDVFDLSIAAEVEAELKKANWHP